MELAGHEVTECEEVANPSGVRYSSGQAKVYCFNAFTEVKRAMYVERVSRWYNTSWEL